MTTISFDAAYAAGTLQKKSSVELREIWMKVCAPPSLKAHMIRDIINFQKKHKSALMRLQDRRSVACVESEFSRNLRGRELQVRYAQSLPNERKFAKSSEIRRRRRPPITNTGSFSISRGKKTAGRKYRVRSRSQERHRHNAEEYEADSSQGSGFLKWIASIDKMAKKCDQYIGSMSVKNVKDGITQWHRKKYSLSSYTSGGSSQ